MLAERARLRERMLHGLDILAQWLADQGNLTQAITYTRRLLELEPWREETHRQTQSDPNRSHSVDQHRREGIRKFEPYWRSLLAEALVSAGQFDKALEEVEDTMVFAKETENG